MLPYYIVALTVCDDGLVDERGESVLPGVRVKKESTMSDRHTRTSSGDDERVMEAVAVVPGTVVSDFLAAGATLPVVYIDRTSEGQPRLNLRFVFLVSGRDESSGLSIRDQAIVAYLTQVVGIVTVVKHSDERSHTINFRAIRSKAGAKVGAYLRFLEEEEGLLFGLRLADAGGSNIIVRQSPQVQAYIAYSERHCLKSLRKEASRLATAEYGVPDIRAKLAVMAGERLFVLLGDKAEEKITALIAEVNVDKIVARVAGASTQPKPKRPVPLRGTALVPPPPGSPVADE